VGEGKWTQKFGKEVLKGGGRARRGDILSKEPEKRTKETSGGLRELKEGGKHGTSSSKKKKRGKRKKEKERSGERGKTGGRHIKMRSGGKGVR